MLQDIATFLAVSGAVVYCVLAAYRQIRNAYSSGESKCSGCTACKS